MIGVLLTVIACLLMLCATLVALLVGRDRAARRDQVQADTDLADARWYLAAAEQGERKALRDLATVRAELHYLRCVVDADTTPDAAPTWADRDLEICRQIWAADGPDTPGSTR